MKKYIPIILICVLAGLARIWWFIYTEHTAEDAFITFQFARRLAEGDGFALNPGQPIYGTTTPLLTILLAFWYIFSRNLALGAFAIGLIASLAGLWFLYFSLPEGSGVYPALILAVSSQVIAEDTMGMETPLLFLFMMGSVWAFSQRRSMLAGIFCGLLLLTRMDSFVFVGAMFIACGLAGRDIKRFLLGTLVYLPWLVFAQAYFGSVIPFTAVAKQVAYNINPKPFLFHVDKVLDYLYPIYLLTLLALVRLEKKNIWLGVFVVYQFIFLCWTGATFFDRYFYTLLVTCLFLIGVEIARIQNTAVRALALVIAIFIAWNNGGEVNYLRNTIQPRHELLREIGVWFNQNTEPGSTIQLEPLGYIGHYADRVMLDEVGLVTPAVVELHRQRIGGHEFYQHLQTDYILLQCGQADHVRDDFSLHYNLIQIFDRGSFRTCYEVWKRL